VWFRVDGEEGQQSGIGKKLFEIGLVHVSPLVYLGAVGTSVICLSKVFGVLPWI